MDMNAAIAKLLAAIIADYNRNSFRDEMKKEFAERLDVSEGKKYIKIISGGGVWGFVVNVDNDKKFRYGDILMAAGWSAPARNSARGNVFEDYAIKWTGPNYLK